MPTKADDSNPGGIDTELALSAVFRVLSHHRRRFAIQYLATQIGVTAVSDLADQIALLEGEHTQTHYERICTSLVHGHLPMLAEAGVVEYDRDQEVVTLGDQAPDVLSQLEVATNADISGEDS